MQTVKLFTISENLTEFTKHDLFILFLYQLIMSSFANALEKFVYYTVSPLPSLFGSPREMLRFPDRIACKYQTASVNRMTYSCAVESSNLMSFHQFFEMPFKMSFQNIHHQFSSPIRL